MLYIINKVRLSHKKVLLKNPICDASYTTWSDEGEGVHEMTMNDHERGGVDWSFLF